MASTESHLSEELRSALMRLSEGLKSPGEIRLKFKPCKTGRNVAFELAELVISSPTTKNALSGRMMCQLYDHIGRLEEYASSGADSDIAPRCLLIYGEEGNFSSGSNLNELKETFKTVGLAGEIATLMQSNINRLERLPLISVAFIQGRALGGAAELTMAADMRLMSPEAQVGFVHARNGICVGWGGGIRLIELVGRSNALELMSSETNLNVQEALAIGYCNAEKATKEEARDFIVSHAIHSRMACTAVKTIITGSSRMTFDEALKLEREQITKCWGQEAHRTSLGFKHKE